MARLTAAGIRAEREAQRISTALRNALGEVLLLACFRLDDLALVEVALVQLLVESLEVKALNDIDWINDIPERFAHFATMSIPNHCVTVDLLEGHLAC